MKYKEAIKIIPSGSDVSIGCRKGAGWFYFTKSDVLRIETEIIFRLMDGKMKKRLNQLRSQMNNPKFIHNVSASKYIRNWKALIKALNEYADFTIIELLECECTIRHKIDGSYGIILKRWNVSGNYWTKEEWERDNGTI